MTTNNGQYNGWYVSPQTLSNQANALSDTLLVIGTTMRLTRLVVTDDLGQWWVKDPLDRLFHPRETGRSRTPSGIVEVASEDTWLARHVDHKYLGGLECPYCVGFHLGWMTMASYYAARRFGLLGPWRFVAGALALNEVTAHLGIKIGDFG